MQPVALDTLFKALADPTRRAVFERLTRDGEASVAALTSGAGVSQPAVSQHLAALRSAGLVAERHEGRRTFYRAEPRSLLLLIDWVSLQDAFWRDRLGRLAELLEELDE